MTDPRDPLQVVLALALLAVVLAFVTVILALLELTRTALAV